MDRLNQSRDSKKTAVQNVSASMRRIGRSIGSAGQNVIRFIRQKKHSEEERNLINPNEKSNRIRKAYIALDLAQLKPQVYLNIRLFYHQISPVIQKYQFSYSERLITKEESLDSSRNLSELESFSTALLSRNYSSLDFSSLYIEHDAVTFIEYYYQMSNDKTNLKNILASDVTLDFFGEIIHRKDDILETLRTTGRIIEFNSPICITDIEAIERDTENMGKQWLIEKWFGTSRQKEGSILTAETESTSEAMISSYSRTSLKYVDVFVTIGSAQTCDKSVKKPSETFVCSLTSFGPELYRVKYLFTQEADLDQPFTSQQSESGVKYIIHGIKYHQ